MSHLFRKFTHRTLNPVRIYYISELGLLEETGDDAVFRLFLGEPEGAQLDDLLSGDLAYGRLMDERGVAVVGHQFRRPGLRRL